MKIVVTASCTTFSHINLNPDIYIVQETFDYVLVLVASTGNITTVSTEEISLLMELYRSESTKAVLPKGMHLLWMANDHGSLKKKAEDVTGMIHAF